MSTTSDSGRTPGLYTPEAGTAPTPTAPLISSPASAGTAGAEPSHLSDPRRQVDRRRLRGRSSALALVCAAIASVAATLGTVVAGRIAESPTGGLVALLALCLVGASVLDTCGKVVWVAMSDRLEGRLREDLLDAALAQPLPVLAEQAVGEVLDRVDDDTHEVGNLLRWSLWQALRTLLGVLPMWIVAGLTWWPAWLLFPLFAALTFVVVRRPLAELAPRKVVEEMAWTDHAAALEEGVAGRDDLRTSLGQAHVVARLARLSATVHDRFLAVVTLESRIGRRAGVLLHSLLAAIGVAGVAAATAGDLSVARLVTLFLVSSTFVGQVAMLANHLPDIQAGMGAVIRLRQLLATAPEPEGGLDAPEAATYDLEVRDLDFSYPEGDFALADISISVPGGTTVALVGRSGSGKSTLASLLPRAVEPPPGTVLLGGIDVRSIDLQQLRARVGVVTQRTEILAGTLAQNITLFGDHPRPEIEAAVAELGLSAWVADLPEGLDTLLGPGGTRLSAGEEQLVAFARLLVRDVKVVVLDEATARMDPLTERRVVAASHRLLRGRTGVLVAHRLSTVERADSVVVLERGRVVQQGPRGDLARAEGPFRELLEASRTSSSSPTTPVPGASEGVAAAAARAEPEVQGVGGRRRVGPPPAPVQVGSGPSLTRLVLSTLAATPRWGLAGAALFLGASLTGAQGAVTGLVWGHMVDGMRAGATPGLAVLALVLSLLAAPLMLASAFFRYPRWWIEILLRVRMSVLRGQTDQRRLPRTPPGEVVGRTMDADRLARYADRWVDFINGVLIALVTALLAGTWVAGAVLVTVLVTSALASSLGRPLAGRSAAEASRARAGFGRALVSVLESARTVKLAAATPDVHAHLLEVDAGRVRAAVREHRVQAVLDGVPTVMVQCGVVAAWWVHLGEGWGLGTTLLVANAVSGFDWFGRVAGLVVTEAPGTRAWAQETSRFAGGENLVELPAEIDLLSGASPAPAAVERVPLEVLDLRGFGALHDDGTIGAEQVDLTVRRGELVLLLGQVGSGKSSLLSALAGLIDHTGEVLWNGRPVADVELFLRPGQVAHVPQVPRVLSGTFVDNVRLGHDRDFETPVGTARLDVDVAAAGGRDALVGHRGVRLSGGQVQRLALARALATDAELLLADDVSSALDATTEVELWQGLALRGSTVVGASAKRSALAHADRVVVMVEGRVAAVGPWRELADSWGHLAG